jgi:hypothetical protein
MRCLFIQPSIFFSFDRSNCEYMAHFLNNVLESQDEEWHENSPEWKRKMAQAAVKAGPGDSCQRASISYLLVLRLNHQRLKYKTKRVSLLSAGVVCPLVKTSPLVSIEIN